MWRIAFTRRAASPIMGRGRVGGASACRDRRADSQCARDPPQQDASWPLQISWWQIVLFGLLAFFYRMSVLLVNLRLRVELYDALLKRALAQLGT
jgi:hypothetical protein